MRIHILTTTSLVILILIGHGSLYAAEVKKGEQKTTKKRKIPPVVTHLDIDRLIAECEPPYDPERGITKLERFFIAIDASNIYDIQRSLVCNADINGTDVNGNTPLIHAIKRASAALEVVNLLVNNPAIKIDKQNHSGETALHVASRERSPALAQTLLEHNANVNAQTDGGFTPIMQAAYNNNANMAKLFVSAGAQLNLKHKGRTAADYTQNLTIKKILHTNTK